MATWRISTSICRRSTSFSSCRAFPPPFCTASSRVRARWQHVTCVAGLAPETRTGCRFHSCIGKISAGRSSPQELLNASHPSPSYLPPPSTLRTLSSMGLSLTRRLSSEPSQSSPSTSLSAVRSVFHPSICKRECINTGRRLRASESSLPSRRKDEGGGLHKRGSRLGGRAICQPDHVAQRAEEVA